jgi:short subunit dehydrogenase-like uncharacterized protein
MADRPYDIVVFGATGFTGGLTAEYLARHAPAGTRWALAGRNAAKLEQVRGRLAVVDPGCAELALLHADVGDPASLRAVAEATKVVITTVGPYIRYGEPLVAACAATGTDYVDLTGEPEFVDRMWLGYHEQAERSGARIVHSCGFDSIPYDLGVQFTIEQLPEGMPISIDGFMRTNGSFSGGTYQSTIEIFSRMRSASAVARERRRREGRPSGRSVRGVTGAPHHDEFGGGWVVPLPTLDPITVLRSARALDRYGPDFSYSHYLAVKRLPVLAGLVGGAGALILLSQIPPARTQLLKLKGSGEGPSEAQRAKSWFSIRFAAHTGDGAELRTEVSGGDPGYTETSKMLAESALCLAHDDLPERAGQLTPAVAMGPLLRRRLEAAGIEFKVLDA